MNVQTSDIVMGVLMAVFALTGLFLASRALDAEMAIFGFSLAGFAGLFIFGLIRRHFDDAAKLRTETPHV